MKKTKTKNKDQGEKKSSPNLENLPTEKQEKENNFYS